jgi:Fe-S cluster assembly iron-binding protein IscA
VASPESNHEEGDIVLTVTHEASKAIQTLTDQIPDADHAGLRISVEAGDGGDAQLALSIADSPYPADEVVESEGATIYIAEPVVEFLDDKTLDATVQDEGVAFSIHAPAAPPDGRPPTS